MSIEDHRSLSPAGSSEANEPRKSSDYAEEESIALLPLDGSRTEGRTASSVNENKKENHAQSSRKEVIALIGINYYFFIAGWTDASTGPLLAGIREHYQVNYSRVSLLFLFNVIGFASAAVSVAFLNSRFRLGTIMIAASCLQIGTALVQSFAPPFWLFASINVLGGYGIGVMDAESNTFLSLLAESASKLSFAHAWYGVGAFVSPLIASGFFVTLPSPGFFHFYRWTAVLGALNLAAMAYNFTGEKGGVTSQGDGDGSVGGGEKQDDPQGTLGKVLRQPIVHLISAFLFVYVGYEVSISGFAPSYLAEIRKAPEDKAGFSSAGFWGGLTLGRFVLIPVSKRLGERLAVAIYIGIVSALQILVWLIPNWIADSMVLAVLGVFLGPYYPLAMAICCKLVARPLIPTVCGWISSIGAGGAAGIPLLLGALAGSFTIIIMQPVLLFMCAIMALLWCFVPNVPQGKEEMEETVEV